MSIRLPIFFGSIFFLLCTLYCLFYSSFYHFNQMTLLIKWIKFTTRVLIKVSFKKRFFLSFFLRTVPVIDDFLTPLTVKVYEPSNNSVKNNSGEIDNLPDTKGWQSVVSYFCSSRVGSGVTIDGRGNIRFVLSLFRSTKLGT